VKKVIKPANYKLIAFFGSMLCAFSMVAQSSYDSLRLKRPKHYFNTVILLDMYRKPEKKISDTVRRISRKLETYGIKEFALSLYTPLMTTDFSGTDSVMANGHLLLTFNFVSLRPQFAGLETQHNLIKTGLGLRYIYNTGKKGVWFFDVSPFSTRDAAGKTRPYLRLASTIVYSHNVSPAFNWRAGITKSFMWGNRYYLPFIGIRVGRLDKVHLSFQFPRNLSVNVPVGHKVLLGLYCKPAGGMYNFTNNDSLYLRTQAPTFHFTRYEINTGLRADVRTGQRFAFYLATGLSTGNNITFYSEASNPKRSGTYYKTYFYRMNTPPTLFLNAGIVLKLGRTRAYYNNKNIYDAIDLNNSVNGNNGNIQIPRTPTKAQSELNLQSISDLVDYNDL
jgi:hypothetical protein